MVLVIRGTRKFLNQGSKVYLRVKSGPLQDQVY